MKTYFLSDHTMIEVTVSDTHSGPDGKPGCQRTSKNVDWYRINNANWEPSPYRNRHQIHQAIQSSHTLKHFREKLEEANK